MDKYEISLWEDYPDLTSNNIPFLNERKICVIGSNTMTSAARVMEPKLVSNVNGTNTFSFKIYYRYKDEVTGEENINPYLPYIINERKVKVLWKGKWYDLVIKKIEEDTQKRFVLCTCEDLFISELSKNGYELEFNSELQNNSGTAEELVDKVLKDSGWQSSEDQQTIFQYQEESVYDVISKRSFVATQQPSGQQISIPVNSRCLIYYSCINKDYTDIQLYYAPNTQNGYDREKNSMLVTGGNCYTVHCSVEIDDDKDSNNFGQVVIKQGSNIIFNFNINNSINDIEKFSNEYRAKRIVKSQLTAFDKLLGRYVDVYTDSNNNEIYGYITTEYSDPALVVNLIVNSKDFKDTQGWVGQDLKWEVYPSFTNENNQTITNYIDKAKSYLWVNTSKIYNTALVSNRQYLVPNSTDIKNGFLGGFQKGEIYIFRYKAKSSLDASEYIKASDHNTKGINCWIQNFTINNSGQYVTNGSSYLVRSALTSITQGSDNWVEVTLNCTKVCTANNLDQVGLFIQATKPCYIEDIQFFKLTQGIDPETGEIKRIDPGEFLLPVSKTIYNYYFADHSYTDGNSQIHIAEDPKDLVLLYSGDIKQGTYAPKYNNYEKITSIEVSKSNRFNILQTIAEKFECWIRFIINHNEETGQILYDENGLPQKYVQLVEQIGNDTGISFEYGIDLKGVKRTIVSNTIATKAIIVPNENEFGKNGFCTIARSPLNYCRENFILNFDYYVQQGLLNKDLLEADLYKTNEPNLGYYFWLNKYNKEYDELVDTVNMLQIRLTKQQAEYTVQFGNLRATTEKLEDNKSDLMILAGVDNFEDAKSYALAHKDNRKVQSLIGSIAKLNNTVKTLAATTNSLESSINALESDIQTRSDTMALLIQNVTGLHKNFFKKYSRFIQEGTWQDQNYVDDDKYYLDALEVAYRSSQPQIQYDISLLRLSSLEDFSSKIFDLGDICYIQDKEFFGYEEDGITPYKQKIIISQLTSFFDTPEKDVIKVQNYATQFDDLFQRITTAAQALQFSQGRYERAAEVVKPDGTLSFGLLQDTFDYNKDLVINSANQEVTWDNTGITVSDTVNSALKVKIMAGGIFASNDGGITWKNALRGDGISTDLLTAGRINTSEIYVYDGNSPSFRWDSQGINAYTVNSTIDPNTGLASREFDFSKFVRFDKFGLYGYDGVEDFEPSTEAAIWDPLSGVKFGLTWKGFFLRGTSGGSNLEISDNGNGITFLMKNTIGNNSLEISTTNDIILKDGNVNRVQIGRLNPNDPETSYGIWIRDNNNKNIFKVTSGNDDDTIGGWVLTENSFQSTSGNNTIGLYSNGKNDTVQGNTAKYYILAGNNFGVTVDGSVYANAGKIAGFTIGQSAIYNNNKNSIDSSVSGVYIGTNGIKLGDSFKVTKDGAVTASNLEITGGSISINYSEGSSGFYVDSDGNLHANSGTFAGDIYAKNIQYGIDPRTQFNYGTLPGLAISPGSINIPTQNIASPLSSGVIASLGYADKYNRVTTSKNPDSNDIPIYFTAHMLYATQIDSNQGGIVNAQRYMTITNGASGWGYSPDMQDSLVPTAAHWHTFTEGTGNDAGKIFIGKAIPTTNAYSNQHSFNIADTAYFKAQVSAKEKAVSIKSNNDKGIEAIAKVGEWDREAFASDVNNIVYGANFPVGTSTTKVIQSFFNIKLTNNNVYSARITIDATKAYNAGQDYGARTAKVASVSITSNDTHVASSNHHYIRTTVKATAKATLSDNSTYTANEQLITSSRDIIADAVWNAVTLPSNGLSQTQSAYSSHNSENSNHISFTISNAGKTLYSTSTKNLYGVFDLTLSNGNTYFMKIGMPTTNVPSSTTTYTITEFTATATGDPYEDWVEHDGYDEIFDYLPISYSFKINDTPIQATAGTVNVTGHMGITGGIYVKDIRRVKRNNDWSQTDSDGNVYIFVGEKDGNENSTQEIDITDMVGSGSSSGSGSDDTSVTIREVKDTADPGFWERDYQPSIRSAYTYYDSDDDILYGTIQVKLSNDNAYLIYVGMDASKKSSGGSSGGTILDQVYAIGYAAGQNGDYESVADARRAANSLSQEIVDSYVNGYAAGVYGY